MAEVTMERHGRAKQLVVFFGIANIGTRGGWGADAVLQACCKVVCRPRGTEQLRGREGSGGYKPTSKGNLQSQPPKPTSKANLQSQPPKPTSKANLQRRCLWMSTAPPGLAQQEVACSPVRRSWTMSSPPGVQTAPSRAGGTPPAAPSLEPAA
ncbi:hypothetical protein HaLaN_19156 [Haematococcus lacustris]|uniref:Uncharacterized protein n=1 Tax=Haematococcus lacustris TaxID=44745 RepID=A0A699ZQ48_HAELA|nr:hypothetical protein HaLaN_19156 [Haematococcus lacustris]